MLKPNGTPAHNVDPLLLIHLWSHHVANSDPNGSKLEMIYSGIGKTSYFLNEDIISEGINYWTSYRDTVESIKKSVEKLEPLSEPWCDEIARACATIDYGLPNGEQEPKTIMAQALSNWYQTQVDADDVIFTVGGWIALQIIFKLINARTPNGRIVTPYPYYTFYANPDHENNLHLVNVMNEPGYRLTAQALAIAVEDATRKASIDGHAISAFLFCDPNNPLGTVVGEREWRNIAAILKTTSPDIPIILDESYAEMTFNHKHVSLLQVAPELKERIIILRSATKSLSASGERMAALACFHKALNDAITEEILFTYMHAPKSSQYGFARALLGLSDEKREALTGFYQKQSEYVRRRLKEMNAHVPNEQYKVESTFYVIANLREIIGTEIPPGAERALGKSGTIETDVDICYSLLFEDRVMLSALSFFGLDPKFGYVRMTTSNGFGTLAKMLDRIENRLRKVRAKKLRNNAPEDAPQLTT